MVNFPLIINHFSISSSVVSFTQCLVKEEKFCFRYLDFYFRHGESTSTASQLTSTASQKSKDSNKISLLLQDLGCNEDFLNVLMLSGQHRFLSSAAKSLSPNFSVLDSLTSSPPQGKILPFTTKCLIMLVGQIQEACH